MFKSRSMLIHTLAATCALAASAQAKELKASSTERVVLDKAVVDDGGGTKDDKAVIARADDDGQTIIGGFKSMSGMGSVAEVEYFDQTPICNYLERGIDDQSPGRRDSHVVMPPGVSTLSDIHQVAFGLDLPATRCQDNPRSIPCSDDSDPRRWCVKRVELEVLGLKLLDMSGPSDGCLIAARGGAADDGIIGLDSAMLRLNNPAWGFTEDELDLLINSVDLSGPTPQFLPPQITFSGEFISRSVESVVGGFFTKDSIGCANGLYCGHRRMIDRGGDGGLMPVLRWASAGEVDCDMGDCPSTASRKSSPWLELAGEAVGDAVHLHFDVDFAADRTVADLGDCAREDETDPWSLVCGTSYSMVARGSIETTAAVECQAMATVSDVSGDADLRLPHCAHAIDDARCIQPSFAGDTGTIVCPEDDEWQHCGESGSLVRIDFDQRMRVVDFGIDLEDGAAVHIGDFLCTLFGCDLDRVVERFMDPVVSRLEDSLVAVPLFSRLDGCPAVSVEDDGTLTINPRDLDRCPPGIRRPGCGGLRVPDDDDGEGSGLRGGFAKVSAPGGDDGGFAPVILQAVPLAEQGPSGYVVGATAAPTRHTGRIDQLTADTPKIPMRDVTEGLINLCALRASCRPGVDLSAMPLRQMATLDVSSLGGIGGDLGAAYDAFRFLAENDTFREDCLGWADAGYDGSDAPSSALEELVFLGALQSWHDDHFADAMPQCRETTPSVEEVLPALGMVLTVTTGDGGVADRFAFVNFRDPAAVTDRDRAAGACTYRSAQGLPPADAPRCADGEIVHGPGLGQACGSVAGGPCADITDPDYEERSNDPSDPAMHPNGNFSWRHRCADNEETAEPMVCVADFYPGAGSNTWPTCKICGTPPDGADPDRYTMIGCPPEGHECPLDLALGLDGKCWDVLEGRPEWECAADCEALYDDTGYCMYAGNWIDFMADSFATAGTLADTEGSGPHHTSICVDWSCDNVGLQCGWRGEACFNGDECVTECQSDADCQTIANNAPAYPNGFVCGPDNTCILP